MQHKPQIYNKTKEKDLRHGKENLTTNQSQKKKDKSLNMSRKGIIYRTW